MTRGIPAVASGIPANAARILLAMRSIHQKTRLAALAAIALVDFSSCAYADDPPTVPLTGGKLLLTGGASEVEGAAGGGLTPWAVVGGYGTASQLGANAHGTYIRTQDYALGTWGLIVGVANRVELSLARQSFDTRDVGAQIGL